jgi:hypothetical protein
MFVLACFSKILDETVGGLISGANEKYKEWRTLNGVESAITDFNEEFSDSALDSGVFSKFINTNEKVKLYFKDYFLKGDHLKDEPQILDEIIETALYEINKQRREQEISLLEDRTILVNYFERLKCNLRNQRLNILGFENRMLAMLIRDNANIDNKAMFEEFQEQILKKIEALHHQNSAHVNLLKVGVRSYLPGTEKRFKESKVFLDLCEFFIDGKKIKDESLWNEKIKPEIQRFADTQIESDVESSVSIDAVQSIAFTLGYYAHDKSNKILHPIQNGVTWICSKEKRIGDRELEFNFEDRGGDAVLILIDLMNRELGSSIEESYHLDNLDILKIQPTIPDRRYVLGGNHCLKLVYEVDTILQNLPVKIKRKKWKFAFTAPNSFIFLLGRQGTQYGEIGLLHFDSSEYEYRDSISLG